MCSFFVILVSCVFMLRYAGWLYWNTFSGSSFLAFFYECCLFCAAMKWRRCRTRQCGGSVSWMHLLLSFYTFMQHHFSCLWSISLPLQSSRRDSVVGQGVMFQLQVFPFVSFYASLIKVVATSFLRSLAHFPTTAVLVVGLCN